MVASTVPSHLLRPCNTCGPDTCRSLIGVAVLVALVKHLRAIHMALTHWRCRPSRICQTPAGQTHGAHSLALPS
eukprot:9469811-Pyramimonas_sp.AAC.1